MEREPIFIPTNKLGFPRGEWRRSLNPFHHTLNNLIVYIVFDTLQHFARNSVHNSMHYWS